MKFLRNFVWNLIEDQVWDAISEFDEDLDAALFGDEECGIESAIESLVKQEIRRSVPFHVRREAMQEGLRVRINEALAQATRREVQA